MKVAVFSTKSYDRAFLQEANARHNHQLEFFQARLDAQTAPLAAGYPGVCVFVNDLLDRPALEQLAQGGTRLVALRCAGFNNVDLPAAEELGVVVVRVPAYSPHAVAEHTVGLILSLNRKIHRAYQRVRDGNFSLQGLMGFDLVGKTAGVVGTGKIGAVVARILHGFGCRLLGFDPHPNPECRKLGLEYVPLEELLARSDIITLHCPLTPQTYHLINRDALQLLKPGAMLINTSRGAVIDTPAVIQALKSGHLGSLGLDVYEEEGDVFFQDLSDQVIQDDVLARLLTFPNVIVTGHQAFFTREALQAIAETTLGNITQFEQTGRCTNQVRAQEVVKPAQGG